MANYVDVIANIMPWAGSLIPATLTYQNVQRNLGFDAGPALMIAAVVEGLGFVTVTTALDLYELRRAENKSQPQAWGASTERNQDGAFWISLAGTVIYLAVVLLVNSILDGGDIWHKLTLGMLSIFGVLGGLMVALRKHLGERLVALHRAESDRQLRALEEQRKAEATARELRAQAEEREREARQHAYDMEQQRLQLEHELRMGKLEAESLRKLEKAKAESLRGAPESGRSVAGGSPARAESAENGGESPEMPRRWADVPAEDHRWVAEAPAKEIVARYKLSGKDPERTARTWKSYAKSALNEENSHANL